MGFLIRMNTNRIVRGIARACTPYLATGYGVQASYTPGQIETSMKESGCNLDHIDNAYVMFGKEEDVEGLCSENYETINGQISESCFDGDTDFSVQDVFGYASLTNSYSYGGGDGGEAKGGGDGD